MNKEDVLVKLNEFKELLRSDVLAAYEKEKNNSDDGEDRFFVWKREFCEFLKLTLSKELSRFEFKMDKAKSTYDYMSESYAEQFLRKYGEPCESFIDLLITNVQNDEYDFESQVPTEENVKIQNITNYNISGHNARVNQNSVDKSTNIINNADTLALLAELRSKIEALDIPLTEKQSANEHLDVIDSQITSEKPSKSVVSAMINHLPDAVKAIDCVNELVNCLQTSGLL